MTAQVQGTLFLLVYLMIAEKREKDDNCFTFQCLQQSYLDPC